MATQFTALQDIHDFLDGVGAQPIFEALPDGPTVVSVDDNHWALVFDFPKVEEKLAKPEKHPTRAAVYWANAA